MYYAYSLFPGRARLGKLEFLLPRTEQTGILVPYYTPMTDNTPLPLS